MTRPTPVAMGEWDECPHCRTMLRDHHYEDGWQYICDTCHWEYFEESDDVPR